VADRKDGGGVRVAEEVGGGVVTDAESVGSVGDGVAVGVGVLARSATVVPTRTTWLAAGLLDPTRAVELDTPATRKPAALSCALAVATVSPVSCGTALRPVAVTRSTAAPRVERDPAAGDCSSKRPPT
jgi:hypothetical protein